MDGENNVRELLTQGHLARLREHVGISLSCQASLIGVAPGALQAWESGKVKPTRASLEKVDRWYRGALRDVDTGPEGVDGFEFGDYVHISVASQEFAMAYVSIVAKCHQGLVSSVHFDTLGWYIHTSELVNRESQ